MTVALGAALAVLAVLLVALPFLREPKTRDDRIDAPTDADLRTAALVEERDRALAALKDLEFDHRTGKITDDDYRTLVPQLRQAAAAALKSLPAVPAGSASRPAEEEPDQPQQRGDDRHPDQELDHGEAEDEQHDHDQ
ncbi:MAG TPA: hypothetical protein VFW85_03445 [Gaiellaceae bacterium]|nr:hypothetical protein [Gaiellaceae bacterium]